MVLVINPGSSSIKFKLFKICDQGNHEALLDGIAERIGVDGHLTISLGEEKHKFDIDLKTHEIAIKIILDKIIEFKVIEKIEDIKGIGFRVVHGGTISDSALITPKLIEKIKNSVKLAPLHNPGGLIAIDAVKKIMPNQKLIACFDTSFHQTISEEKFIYPVPYEWYEKYEVRKYGFHGISYKYIAEKTSETLNKSIDELNIIVCHLGNGSSITAIKNGKSFDTSMGLTPLPGLIMGTRSGDIDSSIIEYMAKTLNKDVFEITSILNKESGLLGLSGVTSDMRDILDQCSKNNKRAILAFEKYTSRVAEYIVNYANQLSGNVDAVVFTAGIGENSYKTREEIIKKIPLLGVKLNKELNESSYQDFNLITDSNSKVKVFVVRTDEEKMICLDVVKLLK